MLLCLRRELPTPQHRLALWSAAAVRELTEHLLRAMLDHEGFGALHEWLCGLTFRPLDQERVYDWGTL